MMDTAMDGNFRVTGRHVLWSLVAFFGIVFGVNGYFLYVALATHTGVVAQEPYRKGLHYNERIAADELQQNRGWAIKFDVAPTRDQITLVLAEPDSRPVTGMTLTGTISRPATATGEVKLALVEQSPGTYAVKLPRLADGTWVVNIEGPLVHAGPSEPPFRMKKRLWLAP